MAPGGCWSQQPPRGIHSMQYVYGFVWAFPDTLLSVRAGGEFTRNAVKDMKPSADGGTSETS